MARRRPTSHREALARRRRRQRRNQAYAPQGEALEQRLVLSFSAAADSTVVTAAQAAALYQGLSGVTSRLTEIQTSGILANEAAALGQPVGTLLPLGDQLRTSLTDRLGSLATGGATTVGDIKTAFADAAAADPALATATITAQLETVGTEERLWFGIDLDGGTELPDYALDLGQGEGAGSLIDAGLDLGPVEVQMTAGFSGRLDLGLDLASGLSAEQMLLVKFDDLRAFGSASHTAADALADIEARFGIVKLGPATVDVALDIGVTFDLTEPAAGWMTLGELTAASAADWLAAVSLAASGTGLDVSIPYTLDIAGFDQALGTAHELAITAADLLDATSLEISFPSLTIPGVGAFDFTDLAEITASDLGVFLSDLGRWVPEIGRGLELPLIDQNIASIFSDDFSSQLEGLVAAVQNADGEWAFDTVQEMIDGLAASLGLTTTDFALAWNPASDALEWTLPLDYVLTATESFDASSIAPAGLPLSFASDGSATIDLTGSLDITAGVGITSSANVTPITAASLLSEINGGTGLPTAALIPGDDLSFTLRDGTTLGFDLDTLDLTGGTATVQDLIDLVTTPGQLTLAIESSSLVATDLTSPATADATFSLVGPGIAAITLTRRSTDPSAATITTATRLSQINGSDGLGVTTALLVAGDDLTFTLRDGTTIGFDLGSLDILDPANTAGTGTATVQDLIDLVDGTAAAAGRLSLAFDGEHLIALDLTEPAAATASFSVAGGLIDDLVFRSTARLQTSLAPAALGLFLAATTDGTLTGASLEGFSIRDRVYIDAASAASFEITLDASLNAGAALGPLTLAVHCGTLSTTAAAALTLTDPGTGDAADGRVFLAEMDDGLTGLFDVAVTADVSAADPEGIFQFQVQPAAIATSLGITDPYVDYCSGIPLTTLPGATIPYLAVNINPDWSFSIDPSVGFSSLLTSGLSGFSIGDLPDLLSLFTGYLEGSGLWSFEFPWVDLTLGDLFGFADIFAELPDFDLGTLFGLPDYSSGSLAWPTNSLGDLGLSFLTELELALPDLAGFDFFDRLQRLSWSLDDLLVDWEGWSPGSPDLDLDFLGRVRAWFTEASLVFPDLWGEWNGGGGGLQDVTLAFGKLLFLPQFSFPDVSLPSFDVAWLGGIDTGNLEASFPGLDFGGLSGFSRDIGRLSIPDGNPLAIDLDLDPSGLLTFTLTVDADFNKVVPIPALDLGGVPLDISTSGELTFDFGGSLVGVFGVDLSDGSFFFDDTASSISLEAQIASDGLGMLATIGGVAGVAIGRPNDASAPAAWEQASINLGVRTDTNGDTVIDANDDFTGPASFTLDGAGTLAVDAEFDAQLPIYVWPEIPGVDSELGTLGLNAAFSVDPDGNDDGTADDPVVTPPSLSLSGVDDILARLTDLSFSFDSWIDGAAELVHYLRTVLATDLVAGLPLVGSIDVSGTGVLGRLEGFFETLAAFNTPKLLAAELDSRFTAIKADIEATTGQAFNFVVSLALDGVTLDATSGGWSEPFENLLTGDVEFVVSLELESTTTTSFDDPSVIDFGVDALGLEIVGDVSINLATSYALDLGLGASLTRGFFIKTGAGNEFTAGFDLFLPEDLALKLGPLVFAYQDQNPALPELDADLTVDFADGSYGLAELGDLFGSLDIGGQLRAEVAADLSAEIFSGLGGPGIGVSLAMGFNDAGGGIGGPGGSRFAITDLDANKFFFEITDTFIDLGGLLSGPIREIFLTVDKFVEPLRPVLDLLTSEVPVLSDVSKAFGGGAVTVLDAIRVMGDGDYDSAVEFIETVDEVSDFVAALGGVASSSKVSLGTISLPSGTGSDASAADLRAAMEAGSANPGAGFDAGDGINATPAESGDDTAEAYSQVRSGSITFPVFNDPAAALVDLLFGNNPSLVHWDLPLLAAGFTVEQSIPIFPPLFAKFFGGFEFATNVSLGYDTRGLRQAMAAETARASKILNGVYLGDVADVTNPNSEDVAELSFSAFLGAGAELNVLVAAAGVSAGVEGTLGANLKDNNNDGKVHLDELAANLRSGPECIFDFEGAIDAFFEASIKVGISVPFVGFVTLWKKSIELLDVRLLEWNLITCPPVEPTLAAIVSGPYDHDNDSGTANQSLPSGVSKALVLNMGPRAGLVLPGETSDEAEEFEIDYDAATGEIIVRAYDAGGEDRDGNGEISDDEMGLRYDATGIDAILFDAGADDDIVLFTANLPTSIAVFGYGGPGNDQITGAPGPNTLHGDGGSAAGSDGKDRLLGRESDDALTGGGANDILYGYGGSDTITGNDGADQIFGDDEAGDLSEAPAGFGSGTPGNDWISGGNDGDTIYGGAGHDKLFGGSGGDTIDAGEGNDWIEGGGGNDFLYGRDGLDLIWGEDRAGSITATGTGSDDGSELEVNADLIEGGLGFNFIHGGPGYDIIYAESEATAATAAAAHAAQDISANFAIPMQSGTVRFTDAVGDWLVAGGWSSADAARGSTSFFSLLVGGDGNDTMYGTLKRDYMAGGFESDFLQGGTSDDYLLGGPGSDAIFAGGGSGLGATIFAGDGDDVVDGGELANYIEGGPGDDRLFGREGEDMIYGGTTGIGYQHYEDDRSGPRPVIDAIHGGYTATVEAVGCGPEISWYPEVYPESGPPIELFVFEDLNANGARDAGEPAAPADTSWTLAITTGSVLLAALPVPGGSSLLPEEGGLPEGDYQLIMPLDFAPAGWVLTTADVVDVTVDLALPSPRAEFGWVKKGSITGTVTEKNGGDQQPSEGMVIYLDADRDGEYDAGEQTAATDAAGTYTFADLLPGSYAVGLVDPGGCFLVTPTSAVVDVASGDKGLANFVLEPRTAPAVEAVLLGVADTVASWSEVPDGAAQADPLAAADYTLLAFEICTAAGLGTLSAGASLWPLDADGKQAAAIQLRFVGTTPAAPTRIVYEIVKPDGQDLLQAGRYRVAVDAGSVTSTAGDPLDGEWTNPSPATPAGSRYPSGDGQAGGDFVFEFEVGAASGASLLGGGSGTAAAATSTIQGTVWQHDPRDTDMGQTVGETFLRGQTVNLVNHLGAVVATQVSGPIDLDGDGIVRGAENAAFRFTNVAAGDYTVEQVPADPWAQSTPGGVLRDGQLLSATFDPASGKSTISVVDPSSVSATPQFDTPLVEVRDIALAGRETAWLTGLAAAGNVMAPGTAGLWTIDLASGTVTEIGPTPNNKPLLSLDALDDRFLLGIASDGTVVRYDTVAGSWSDRGPLLDAGGQAFYPVGDAAVVAADEVYLVGLTSPPTFAANEPGQQKLLLLNPQVLGANTTVVRGLKTTEEHLIGLETGAGDNLIGLGTQRNLYRIEPTAAGGDVQLGRLAALPGVAHGGLSGQPGGLETDAGRNDFALPLKGGETIEIGFGNEPAYQTLLDGDDTIDGGCGSDADTLHGDDGPGLPWYVITIGGNDTIRGRGGDDQIEGGQQGDRLFGQDGDDTVLGGDSEPNWIEGGAGIDRLTGGAAGDTILGGDDADTIAGLGGGDLLFGEAGDDTLTGGDDDDVLVGGAGEDTAFGNDGNDVLFVIDTASGGAYGENPLGAAADSYDGGAGLDTIIVVADTDVELTDALLTLLGSPLTHGVASIEAALLTGGANANTLNAAGFSGTTAIRGLAEADILIGGSGVDLILGGAGADTITGNAGDDDLDGGDDNDTITGDAGNDTIRGGGGRNRLTGGADNDTFIYVPDASRPDDLILDIAAADTDTLDMTAVTDSLTMRVGESSGSSVRISGYAPIGSVEFAVDAIESVLLGSGNDLVYLRDGIATVAAINAGGGTDLLSYAETGHVWASNVAVDLAGGTATATGGIAGFENATGGDGDDALEGDAGPNTLSGGGGNNTLIGHDGDDTLRGGLGDDTIKGGAGADTISGYGGVNTLVGGTGDDTYRWFDGDEPTDTITEVAGEGDDTLSFASVSAAVRVEVGGQILATYGTAASVTATAADGIDSVIGGSNADRFVIADATSFAGLLNGGGVQSIAFDDMNTLDYSAWTSPITVDYTGQLDASFITAVTGVGSVRWLQHVIGGLKGDSLTAGDQPVWFEGGDGDDTLNGSSQGDLLEGNAGDDTISALAGNDTLRGGLGTDTLAGGTGDDVYAFADVFGSDTILENPGEGDDTMDFSAVLAALQIRLGSVTVTDGTSTAVHADDNIELVIGGQADDAFFMTRSNVVFPGVLDGGNGTNSLTYEKARDPIIDAVDRGETPNVDGVVNISSVTAEPIYTRIEVTVAAGAELIDTTVYTADERIVKKGKGRLILTKASSHTGGALIEGGELVIRDPAALGTGGLEITGGGTATLELSGGTLPLSRLKLAVATKLDIGDGGVIVGAGGFTAADIRQAIIDGRNTGSWDGSSGITSSTAAGSQGGASIAAANTFGVGYTIDSNGVLTVKTVMEGDTDLDGSVDFDDILNLFPFYGETTGHIWQRGDITYDGKVDFDDILALFPNYGTTQGAGASGLGSGSGSGSAAGLLGNGGSGSGSGTSTSTDDADTDAVMGPEPPSGLSRQTITTLTRDGFTGTESDATSLAFAALAAEQDSSNRTGSKKTSDLLFAEL